MHEPVQRLTEGEFAMFVHLLQETELLVIFEQVADVILEQGLSFILVSHFQFLKFSLAN